MTEAADQPSTAEVPIPSAVIRIEKAGIVPTGD
jgi:hypothetical protein